MLERTTRAARFFFLAAVCASCNCGGPAAPSDAAATDMGAATTDAAPGTDAVAVTDSAANDAMVIDGGLAATYLAEKLPTGAVRYGIVKVDETRDLCFSIVVMGGMPGPCSVSQLFDCNVDSVAVQQGAATCTPGAAFFDPGVGASTVSGTIDLTPSPGAGSPCLIDLDLTATYPPAQPWVPTTPESFFVVDLVIGGC